ncbi:MAG: hypothetical protein AB7V62_10315 [Thermoleophilia bacterium]
MSVQRAIAHLDEPIQQAASTVVHVAAQMSWGIVGNVSDQHRLVFSKGVTATSWAGDVTVVLEAVGPAETMLVVESGRAVPPGDWGRGREAVGRIFAAAG